MLRFLTINYLLISDLNNTNYTLIHGLWITIIGFSENFKPNLYSKVDIQKTIKIAKQSTITRKKN